MLRNYLTTSIQSLLTDGVALRGPSGGPERQAGRMPDRRD